MKQHFVMWVFFSITCLSPGQRLKELKSAGVFFFFFSVFFFFSFVLLFARLSLLVVPTLFWTTFGYCGKHCFLLCSVVLWGLWVYICLGVSRGEGVQPQLSMTICIFVVSLIYMVNGNINLNLLDLLVGISEVWVILLRGLRSLHTWNV